MKSKNRQLLEVDRDYILWLSNYKCAKCGSNASVAVHEIIPISRGKKSLELINRIALCYKCHDWAHRIGTHNSARLLTKIREKIVLWKFGSNGENQETYKQEQKNRQEL